MEQAPRSLRLVLVPALLTLAVTILRLVGERQGWSPLLFSTKSGGGFALVGIAWLIPVFGAWFGFRLARAGLGPARAGRALLLGLVAVAVYVGGFQVVIRGFAFDTSTRDGLVYQLLGMGVASILGALVALLAWPGLFLVDLLYGLCARLPTIVITWLAVVNAWGTHYEKFGLQDYMGFAPAEHAFWLGYTQLVFWPGFTVVAGGLVGTLAAAIAQRCAKVGGAAD